MFSLLNKRLKPFNRYGAVIFITTIMLIGFGLVMIYSATGNKFGYYYFQKQLNWFCIGLVPLIFFTFFPHKFFKLTPIVYTLFIITISLLIIVLVVGVGIEKNSSIRWLSMGGINFQPSEIARFTTLIYLAYSLSKKNEQETIGDFFVGVVPHIIFVLIFFFLISMQPDLGTAMLLVVFAYAMMFNANVKIKHLFLTFLPVLPFILYYIRGYHIERIKAFLDPLGFQYGKGYQALQSMFAFAIGNISGSGMGMSFQKLDYLPEAHTDFILSIIGEETGFIGLLILLIIYFTLIFIGFLISYRSSYIFSKLMGIALTINIAFPAIINIFVAIHLIPVTGMVLPFISYGGTSLVINMACIGILINIAGRNEALNRVKI